MNLNGHANNNNKDTPWPLSLNGARKAVSELKDLIDPPRVEIEDDGEVTRVKFGGRVVKTLLSKYWRAL